MLCWYVVDEADPMARVTVCGDRAYFAVFANATCTAHDVRVMGEQARETRSEIGYSNKDVVFGSHIDGTDAYSELVMNCHGVQRIADRPSASYNSSERVVYPTASAASPSSPDPSTMVVLDKLLEKQLKWDRSWANQLLARLFGITSEWRRRLAPARC